MLSSTSGRLYVRRADGRDKARRSSRWSEQVVIQRRNLAHALGKAIVRLDSPPASATKPLPQRLVRQQARQTPRQRFSIARLEHQPIVSVPN
jgi:hypothetical protein